MGSKPKKDKAIDYKGASPTEIQAQYKQQAQLMAEQQSNYTSQFQTQFNSLRDAYNNSVNILTGQFQERDKTQSELLGQLRTQYAATQSENSRNRGLYDNLLSKQSEQEALAKQQQYKAQVQAQEAMGNLATDAGRSLNTMNQRRRVSQTNKSQVGSLSAYSAASQPLMSLLR